LLGARAAGGADPQGDGEAGHAARRPRPDLRGKCVLL